MRPTLAGILEFTDEASFGVKLPVRGNINETGMWIRLYQDFEALEHDIRINRMGDYEPFNERQDFFFRPLAQGNSLLGKRRGSDRQMTLVRRD